MAFGPLRLQLQTVRTGGILMGKITIRRVKCLAKVVHIIETVNLSILTSVRMTHCPYQTRHKLQTFWTGGILTGKMKEKVVDIIETVVLNNQILSGWLLVQKCLAKVVNTTVTVVLNIQTPVRITSCPQEFTRRLKVRLAIVKRLGLGLGTGIGDWNRGLGLGTGIGVWDWGWGMGNGNGN